MATRQQWTVSRGEGGRRGRRSGRETAGRRYEIDRVIDEDTVDRKKEI
jgi:hypothetical protein